MFGSAYIAFLTVALTVAATPVTVAHSPISLPFAKRVNTTGSINVVQSDLARIRALRARTQPVVFQQDADAVSEPVTNELVSYIASVGVGSPATNCKSSRPFELPVCNNKPYSIRRLDRRHGKLQHLGWRRHEVQDDHDQRQDQQQSGVYRRSICAVFFMD